MADISQLHHISHAVKHVPVIIHYIHTGFSMSTLIISNLISAGIAASLTWFVTSRGIKGVQTDLANAQAELSTLKTKTTTAVAAAETVV